MHSATTLETCANCGAMIGPLETPHVWREQVVCAACHARLAPTTLSYSRKPPALPKGYKPPDGPLIICPNSNCCYRGPSRRISRGSMWITLLLLCIGIVPGLLYSIFCERSSLHCPNCGIKVIDD